MLRARFALAVPALVALAAAAPAQAAAVRTGPSGSRFYTPPKSLPGKTHGDPIWQRRLTGPAALRSASSNRLVLYRSTGSDGKAIAVSGAVSLPKGKVPRGGWPVITYDHGTTGIADQCAPTRDNASNGVHGYNAYAYPLLNRWLKAGFAVVRTDYQGLGTPGAHEYLVGREEGRATLDMVRAARTLSPAISKRVIISGHSQGGHAALWAASLAGRYTRELQVRGTVAFAPASHLAEQAALLPALKSPSGLSGLAAMILRGIDTAKPSLDIPARLSDRARALYPQTLTACLDKLSKPDSFGGIAPADLFKPGTDTSDIQAALRANDPEHLKIATPVRVEQGTADTTVFPAFTDATVKELQGRGVKVTYKKYEGVTHGGVVDAAAADSIAYIKRRLR